MGLAMNVMKGGFSAGQAKSLNGAIATALTAAGTVITDAFDLVADINVIGTCASGAGVQLPSCKLEVKNRPSGESPVPFGLRKPVASTSTPFSPLKRNIPWLPEDV